MFCLSFSSLVLLSCFPAWLLLLVLSCFLGFVAWLLVLVGLLFLFPLRTASDIKRKGTKVLPLCPLLTCCGVLYLRIAAAFLSATAAALWHSWSDPKNGGICGNSGINTIKQSFKGCFSIFANLNDFITCVGCISLVPCALLRVFGCSRLCMLLYLP